jgi:hypothetical protein
MRLFIVWVSLVGFIPASLACDVCGSSAAAFTPGLQAFGNRPAIGIQQHVRSFQSTHPGIFGAEATRSQELFLRFECRFQIPIRNRWQIIGQIPVSIQKQVFIDTSASVSGLADCQIGAQYVICDRKDSSAGTSLRISIGGGIKLPTGLRGEVHNRFFLLHPGTGTWDPFMTTSMIYQRRKWIVQFEANGMLRTTSNTDYKPGNSLQTGAIVYYRKYVVWPFAGVQYSWNGSDLYKGQLLGTAPSRGNIIGSVLGFTWPIRNWVISGNTQIPVYQHLSGGLTQQKLALSLTINYFFK